MENKKITIARCVLSLAAILAMLSFAMPALRIEPIHECKPCNELIKEFKKQNTVSKNNLATFSQDSEA